MGGGITQELCTSRATNKASVRFSSIHKTGLSERPRRSQRRFLQPNPSKRAPRLHSFHLKSLFPPSVVRPPPLLLTPDRISANTVNPSGQPLTHPPTSYNVHLLNRLPLSYPSAAPRLHLSPSLRTVVPAEHTPCRSHPLPRLRIRPSQTDLSLSLPWLANRPLASTSRLLLHIRLLRNGVESMHAPPPTAGRRQWLCALCDRATLAPNNPRPLLTINFCSSSGNISSW